MGGHYQERMNGDTPAPPLRYALEGHGLVKTFGSFRAVDGVDIAVPAGSIYGVLGPNCGWRGRSAICRKSAGFIRQ